MGGHLQDCGSIIARWELARCENKSVVINEPCLSLRQCLQTLGVGRKSLTMTTYLLSGANRGIGRGIADIILSRPNNTLVALVRDPEHETSKSLSPNAEGTKVINIKYDASEPDSGKSAVGALQKQHGINHLDVVIANAGLIEWRGPSVEVTPEIIHHHMNINTIAPILLFSATLPLLRASKKPQAKFFAISSAIGSIETIPQLAHASVMPYGMSKAAMNHAFRKLNLEHPDIDVEMLTPGPVATDLMRKFRTKETNPQLRIPGSVDINDSVKGLMQCIDNSSKETTGGGFRDWAGKTIPW